jgi:hypothetical protein
VAVWTAKHLKRGETWYARNHGCEGQLKDLLLQMIEWHERSGRGWDLDTWEDGRFIEQWATSTVVEELRRIFSHYDPADTWHRHDRRPVPTTVARDSDTVGLPFEDDMDRESIASWPR